MKHEPKLQFEAVRDLDYDGSIGHIVSNRTFDGDEGIEVLTDDFNKLWNRGFYYDEAEIIVRHLNAALDEMNALGTQSYFESGIKGYFLGEPIDRPSNDPCTSPECLAAYMAGWKEAKETAEFRAANVVNSPLYGKPLQFQPEDGE